jgi:predicted Fe-Mo cluster-binding NifX family protein
MKIAITTGGKDLDAPVDPRFGRAKCFIIYDTETGEWSVLDNAQNLQAAQGAGIQAATSVVRAGAEAVLTGNCGPKAFATLAAGKVKVYTAVCGTVRDVVEKFKAGELQPASEASVDAHFGSGL